MFDDLKYPWAVRKHLKNYMVLSRTLEGMPDDPESPGEEPRYKYAVGKQLNIHSAELDEFRSKYLMQQAYKYHVPIPEDEESWENRRYSKDRVLTAAAAQKLRADIRAEQKADWDYWANRITLGLALVGSIFGVLAFFRK
jgi:hypothetical protein